MSNVPEGAHLEYQKTQLIGSLGAVAETMRNCAAIADQFSQMLAHGHVNFNGAAPLHMMPPGLNAAIADPKQFFALPSPAAATPAERKRKAEAQDPDEDGKKKKRGSVKKPKDPNAPKRPASSYIFFQNEIRSQLKSKHPNMTQHELLNHISKQWSEMTPPQRDVYEKKQAAAKARYEAEKKVYEARDAVTSPVVVAAVIPDTPSPIIPAAIVPSSDTSEDDASDDDDSSSETSEEDKPSPKKSKVPPAPAPKPVATPKEKKHKKTKA